MDVYTDGACSGNPGPGGWAWVATDGRHDSGGEADSTNQRMELTAVLRAIEANLGELHIYSDSTYVVNCFNDRWYDGWLKRDWKNSQKKPVANRDLWEPLIEAYLAREAEISFNWVKGHSGVAGNEEADRLAVAEVERLRESLAAEIASGGNGGAGGPEAPWPVEQAIVITGAREIDDDQTEELVDAVSGLDGDNDIVVSGLRLGAELAGAEAARVAGVPIGVVLPYPDPVKVWSPGDRARFDAIVAAAHWVVTLDGDPAKPGPSIKARNAWMLDAAVGAIVVGDEKLADDAEETGLGVIVI